MISPLIIAAIVALVAHDAFGLVLASEPLSPTWATTWTLGPQAAIALLAHLAMLVFARRIDRTGSVRLVAAAEATLMGARALAVVSFLAAAMTLGWIETVRGWVGDLVLVDELLILAPPVALLAAGWFSFYPIERRVHEAMILRALDEGRAIHPPPSRGRYVLDRLRYRALMALVPLTAIIAWSEAAQRAITLIADRTSLLQSADAQGAALAGAQLVGVAMILLLAPLVIRFLWDTVPLGAGPLRDRLEAMCRRHGVRCRAMLLWRTQGMMLNGAVIGVMAPLRYILLTDALLERLSDEQIEAVVAHELGHVKRRHIPWLVGALAAGVGAGTLSLALPVDALSLGDGLAEQWRTAIDAGVFLAGIGLGLVVFGVVSRLFERQADAFAVQHLSAGEESDRATERAAETMAGALGRVADLNHVPRRRFTWRHGSIAHRQRRVRALAGTPLDAFPVDAAARRAKLATVLGVAAVVALGALDAAGVGPFRGPQPAPDPFSTTFPDGWAP